jgi:nucleoside phosphorylase
MNNISFVNFRVISDVIGEESLISMYYDFANRAANKSIDAILSIIE